MKKLDDLIKELCPNGVEYYSIEDLIKNKIILTVTPTFKIKSSEYKNAGKVPIISQEIEYISGYYDIFDDKINQKEYVCFGDHSEHIKYIDFAFVQGADGLKIMYTDKEMLLARYFYHSITNFYKRHNNYERHFKYFCETVIPVPPLEVQNEIVRILDRFTELTAELTARKKQYEFYRDKLLDFNIDSLNDKINEKSKLSKLIKKLCPNGVEYKTINEVTKWDKNFNNIKNNFYKSFKHVSAANLKSFKNDNGTIKLLSTGNFDGEALKEEVIEYINNDEIFTIPSGGSANIKYYKGEFVDSGNIIGTSLNSDLYNTKYIYYFLLNNNDLIESYFRGSGVKHPDMSAILNIEIPVPPLEVQNEIVRILDKFDKLVNDISEGLPAEIEGRKKQYEYYRDKLLTFKELE